MGKKGLIIWIFVFVLGLSCIVNAGTGTDANSNANAGADEEKTQQPSEKRQEKLQAIDKSVSESRQRISSRYSKKIEELRQQAVKQTEQFEAAERAGLAGSAVKAATFYESVGYVPKGYTQNEDGFWLSDQRLAETEKRIADKKSEISQALQADIDELERQQKYLLNVGLKDLKERLREDVLKPRPQQPLGMLCGIVHVEEKRAALINRTIVHEGDIINGVSVVRIERRKVEFEKDGSTWDQKVGGAPGALWDTTASPKKTPQNTRQSSNSSTKNPTGGDRRRNHNVYA